LPTPGENETIDVDWGGWMMGETGVVRKAMVIAPGQGRAYSMGRMRAIFKADCEETDSRYSVSEWWLEPCTRGPGLHMHEDDHVFYVMAGTLSVRVHDDWLQVAKGGYAVIPGGTPHTFENQGSTPSGFISFTSPGGFEARMRDIESAMAAEDLRL
jgi:mannose-6-phosphate isomerase-like protein (cupin superfamily)